jgi:hypothetical protein
VHHRNVLAVCAGDAVQCGKLSNSCGEISEISIELVIPKVVTIALNPLIRPYPSAAYAALSSLPAMSCGCTVQYNCLPI